MYVYTYVYINVMYVCMYVCMYIHICIYVYIYIYIFIYLCMLIGNMSVTVFRSWGPCLTRLKEPHNANLLRHQARLRQLVLILLLQTQRETDSFFAASRVQHAQHNKDQFRFRLDAFYSQLKSKVGNILNPPTHKPLALASCSLPSPWVSLSPTPPSVREASPSSSFISLPLTTPTPFHIFPPSSRFIRYNKEQLWSGFAPSKQVNAGWCHEGFRGGGWRCSVQWGRLVIVHTVYTKWNTYSVFPSSVSPD